MTGMWTVASDGTFVKATQGFWAADDSGTFRPVRNAWASKADGSFTKIWPFTISIDSFTVDKGTPSYVQAVLNWQTTNADHVEVRITGATAALTSTAPGDGSYTFTGVPGTKYSFSVRAVAADNSYVDSAPVTITLDQLPAPVNFRKTAGAYNNSTFAWNAVPSASGYKVIDTLHGDAVKASGSPLTWTEIGLSASTVYERAVVAQLGSALSPPSNRVRYTTPAAPGTPPGTYSFPATYAEAWAPGYGQWRGAGSGIIHGNGDNWGGANGDNVTFFFYNLTALRALSGRVTRFKIRIKRDSTAGLSSAQTNHFLYHTAATRPAGNPVGYLGFAVDAGAEAWNDESLVDLPVNFGQSLIDATAGVAGVAWGYVAGRYMRGPSLSSLATQGELYITIG